MTNYKMTWRKEQGGRWRKRYDGRDYYFARKEGETKAASYSRCWAEWLIKKKQIDEGEQAAEPWFIGLSILIRRTKAKLLEIQDAGDTPENRQQWVWWRSQLRTYEWYLENGVDREFEDPHNPTDFIDASPDNPNRPVPAKNPPWDSEDAIPDEVLATNIKSFLDAKEAQANRGELSKGRYESIRIGLELFLDHVGRGKGIEAVNTPNLSLFRDFLQRKVDEGMSSYSARDRLQAVKQFTRWAYERELLDLPRVIQSRDFKISVQQKAIATFDDSEIETLLIQASENTKLYLLLMLNCGMQQGDISDLLQSEVDWEKGYLTRKRSKTKKVGSVPEVSYKLWPTTFELLKTFRSKDKSLALTNANGAPLKTEIIENGRMRKVDNIRSAYSRLSKKTGIKKPPKLLRKTAATKLGSHPEFGKFAQHFLGHAPSTVADRHYITPDQKQFDKAIKWLGEQFLKDTNK